MLTSLEIKNFRTFSHLAIGRLGRVNLIVGKNNVGKTTLLEALRLYGSVRPPQSAVSILHERNEVVRSAQGKTLLRLDSLYHGYRVKEGDAITIGQLGAREKAPTPQATTVVKFEQITSSEEATDPSAFSGPVGLRIESGGLRFTLRSDGSWTTAFWETEEWKVKGPPDPPYLRNIGTRHDFEKTIADWWDDLSLTEAESRVVGALQVVAPIRGVRFITDPRSDAGRMPIVGVEGAAEPLSLATLGDGAVRMFQLAVALEYAAVYGGQTTQGNRRLQNVFPLLLIDEVESGIHHTLHADLWRFIFHAARLLEVQVFATTHSWDCLRGFAEAVGEDEKNDGLAIRLETVKGHEATRAVVIDRSDLPIVVRDSIEVR